MCFFLMHRSYFRVFFWVPQIQGSITPLPSRSKSFKRVVEWHDQLVSSKSLNITKIYQLIDELTWLHGKNNVL
jgi:hypothetical protein